jgi:hypothetical protein
VLTSLLVSFSRRSKMAAQMRRSSMESRLISLDSSVVISAED